MSGLIAFQRLDPFQDTEIRPKEIVDGLNNSHFSVEKDTSLSPCVKSIGDIAKSVAVRDARGLDNDPTDSETSTMRTSSDWQFISDDPDEPTPEELKSEFDVAKKLGARLCDAEMPTLALELHLDAVNLALELERRNIRSFRLEDHISLKARYVETLISCKRYVETLISCERREKLKEEYHVEALNQLNEMVENIWNASSEDNVLATCRMWIKAEDLAHRLDDVELSIKCLRKVFNYHFNSENIDASALIPILQLLCRRYEAIGKWGKSESLRKMVHTKLGSDPTTAEVMRLEEAKAWCLDKGFEVEVINQELWFDKRINAKGNRPLHEAAMNHDMNLDILRTLMRSEEHMLTDDYGDTALLAAVDLSNYKVTEVLLGDSRLAHIRARDSQTSLHRCQDENVMRLLIKAIRRRNSSTATSALDPIDINSRDNFDRVPLHLACARGNVGVVQALLEGDADVNAVCHSGETPLLAACFSATPRRDLVPIVQLLVAHRANVEVKDKSNRDVRVALKRRGFSKKEAMEILSRNGP